MRDEKSGFEEYISQWQKELEEVWGTLPKEKRERLFEALRALPGDLKGWRGLIDQALEHVRQAIGDKHGVAIIGPVNVGKSTLYNQFVRKKNDLARVSAVPGTTRYSQEADAGIFTVIDTPGADAPGVVGEDEKGRALQAARGSDVIVLLFDAMHGIRAPEQRLFAEVSELGKPTIVALNKIDLLKKERPDVIGKAAGSLGIPSDQLIPISAKEGEGLERVLLAIAKSEPGIVAALGAALPEYRWKLMQATVMKAASTAAAIAIAPLPFLDFIPLVGIQSAMVMTVARIYAYKITLARARELVATFGLGLLGRTLFYELSKLAGPPSWLLAAAVAAGTTAGMGYAAAIWFERGERLSQQALKRISRAVSETVIDQLKSLGKRRPKRATLRERVRESLEELPPLEPPEENG
jgi:small GTP-binding protein